MKSTLKLLAFFFAVGGTASAQVAPAATGPGGLAAASKLDYALRYSESAQFITGQSSWQTATASGSINYASGNERSPFSLEYGGGYNWTLNGPAYESGQFHHLYLSQGAVFRRWSFTVSDSVSYLPMSPTTGFSGIAGTGEPIGGSNPAPPTSQTILALNTHAVENIANGEVTHDFSHATSLSAGGTSGVLRYPDGNGLDTDFATGNATFTRHLNGRNALFGTYQYSDFSYPGYNLDFQTNKGYLGYGYRWTRNLESNISAGPQWVSGSNAAAVPSSTNLAMDANIDYHLRFTSAGASYDRGTNGGGGYMFGSRIDSIFGHFSRQFGMNMTFDLTGGYQRTAGLNGGATISGKFGGAEATWRLGRNVIVFANYTGTDQSSTSALPANALGTLMQTIGFGVGYSPRGMNRKH